MKIKIKYILILVFLSIISTGISSNTIIDFDLCYYISDISNTHTDSSSNIIINTYTPVLDIICNTIIVSNPSGFNEQDKVIIIQMKGAAIDYSNSNQFGDITSYNNAGNYEINTIKEIIDNKIKLVYELINDYDTSGKVQLISFPVYENLTIDNELTALSWDGNTGGLLAFEVTGTLIMNNNIDVSGKGFRGAATINNITNYGASNYYYSLSSKDAAKKGEGIHEIQIDSQYKCGKGANANGGGGGNGHNRGGGGGGNNSNGGLGGKKKADYSEGRGIGGKPLNYSNKKNKIFIGGGGGAGEMNNSQGTAGENGGGIIIIKTEMMLIVSVGLMAQVEVVQVVQFCLMLVILKIS